jgi:uncharacterized protein (TIGR02996 family)
MSISDPDWIALHGINRMLLNHPLESFLRDRPGQRDLPNSPNPISGRGYRAHWEVRTDDFLWLTDVAMNRSGNPLELSSWPGLSSPLPVRATWVNQCLRTPDARQRRFSPIGNGTIYARESFLSIWRGRLVMIEEIDGRTGRRVGGGLTGHLESLFGPEEAAFLRSAFNDPDDAAPRLVYADWLEDRHDPRSAVVRLAESLTRLDPEVATWEPSVSRDVIRRGLDHWLWLRLLGYQHLATELVAAMA